jgi:hypothetical protein
MSEENQQIIIKEPRAAGPTVQAVALREGTFLPASMAEVTTFAQLMASSGPAIGKPFRGQPGLCLAVIMQAINWQMEPFSVASKAYVVNDKVAYEAQLIAAVVNTRAGLVARPSAKYDGQGPERRVTISGMFKGDKEVRTYESPRIKDIKTKNSPLWQADPDQQIFYFAIRSWARRWCPEVLLGALSVDEAETLDLEARDVTEDTQAASTPIRSPQQAIEAFAKADEPAAEREPGDEEEGLL